MLNTKLRHSCILDYDLYRKNIDLVENRRMPTILAHAAEPKPKVSFTGVVKMCPLSVVVVVVVVDVVVGNCSHFHLLLQNHRAKFNQASLREGDSSLF